jgi:hypothetical protein
MGAMSCFRFGGADGGDGGGGDVNYIWQATVLLTDAQIKALPTTPVTLAAAPGANRLIRPLESTWIADTSAGVYTNLSANISLRYDVGTLTAAVFDENYHGALSGAFLSVISLGPLSYVNNSAVIGNLEGGLALGLNGALTLYATNTAGNFTGGHASNTLRVTAPYLVIDTTTGLLVPTA